MVKIMNWILPKAKHEVHHKKYGRIEKTLWWSQTAG